MPKALADKPECPMELAYVWGWYLSVHNEERLTFTMIKDWAYLQGVKPNGFEADLMMSLDKVRSNG